MTDSLPDYKGALTPAQWADAKASCTLFCPACTLKLQRRSRRISMIRRQQKTSQGQSYYWCERCRIGWCLPRIMKLKQLELPGMGG